MMQVWTPCQSEVLRLVRGDFEEELEHGPQAALPSETPPPWLMHAPSSTQES
jgi:hypothetical protein